MNRIMRIAKLAVGALVAMFTLVSKLILQLILWILVPLSKVFRKILDKLHISITFKLNLVYGISYILLFLVTYGITIEFYLNSIEHKLPIEERLVAFKMLIGMVMAISFVCLLLVGKLATRGIKKSLKSMNETIQEIDSSQLKNRIDIGGTKDELKDLADTFNKMMDKLEGFVEGQKKFVSDASHELRTPIAVIQGYANLLSRWGMENPQVLEESIVSIKEESENMQQLVEKLLFLARADKKTQAVKLEKLNLSEVAREIIKHTELIDDSHDIKTEIDHDVYILGDTSLIKELMRIFIDNAMKYTEEDGKIEVLVKRSRNNALLIIRDTGKGIAKEHIPFIFDRFYQEDEARTHQKGSSGLGLAIAKWIIEEHHGKVYVNSIEGEGTEFIVFFDQFEEKNKNK